MAPSTAIEVSSKSLSNVSPWLMPFHIAYSGPAKVSTFFRVRDAAKPSWEQENDDSSQKDGVLRKTAKRFVAAFRGRVVQGLEVSLPSGYTGVVLRGPGADKGQKQEAKKMMTPRSRRKARGEISSAIDVDVDIANVRDEEDAADRRVLRATGIFDKIVVWAPDIPVDEARDEYIRGLNEWIAVAEEVHAVPVPVQAA